MWSFWKQPSNTGEGLGTNLGAEVSEQSCGLGQMRVEKRYPTFAGTATWILLPPTTSWKIFLVTSGGSLKSRDLWLLVFEL